MIPLKICDIQTLIAIDLSSNKLTGNIPHEFGNLPNLRDYLRLQHNNLQGLLIN